MIPSPVVRLLSALWESYLSAVGWGETVPTSADEFVHCQPKNYSNKLLQQEVCDSLFFFLGKQMTPTPPKKHGETHSFWGGDSNVGGLLRQPCPMTEWDLPTFQADFLVPIKPSGLSFVVGKLPRHHEHIFQKYSWFLQEAGLRRKQNCKTEFLVSCILNGIQDFSLPTDVNMAVSQYQIRCYFSHKKDTCGREVIGCIIH